MKGLVTDFNEKVPITNINKNLDKYQNGKRVLELLAKANKWLLEVQLPDIQYDRQAELAAKHRYTDTLVEQELSVAHQPTPVYGQPKEEEK